jgi:hypothetical protein
VAERQRAPKRTEAAAKSQLDAARVESHSCVAAETGCAPWGKCPGKRRPACSPGLGARSRRRLRRRHRPCRRAGQVKAALLQDEGDCRVPRRSYVHTN